MNFVEKTMAERLFVTWSRNHDAPREALEQECVAAGARKEYFNGWGAEADAWIFADNSWVEIGLNDGPVSAHLAWEGSPKKKT